MSKFVQMCPYLNIFTFKDACSHNNQLFYVNKSGGTIQWWDEGGVVWAGLIPKVTPPLLPGGGYYYDVASFEGDLYAVADGALYRLDYVAPNWLPTLVCNRKNDQYVYSMKVIDGRLYGVTYSYNPAEPGGRCYRMNLPKNAWEQVADTYSVGTASIWDRPEEFNGRLYAVSVSGALLRLNVAQDAWERLIPEGSVPFNTAQQRLFGVHNNRLYISVFGAILVAYVLRLNATYNAWEVMFDTSAMVAIEILSRPISFKNALFVGTWRGGLLLYFNDTTLYVKTVCNILNFQDDTHVPVILNNELYFAGGSDGRLFRADITLTSIIDRDPSGVLRVKEKCKFTPIPEIEGPTP